VALLAQLFGASADGRPRSIAAKKYKPLGGAPDPSPLEAQERVGVIRKALFRLAA
jgi:hypothetical protein